MAGVEERMASEIERTIGTLPHPTSMLRGGDSPEDVLSRIFGDAYDVLERVDVRYHCPCSRERVERALLLLGGAELQAILEKDRQQGFTEVTCEFCNTRYELSTSDIEQLMRAARDSRVA
jgi:molecular chaperone Hsp33